MNDQQRNLLLYIVFGVLFVTVTILLKPLTGSLLLLLVPETMISRMTDGSGGFSQSQELAVIPIHERSK